MRTLILWCCIVAFSTKATIAQNTLSGQIKDAETGKGIPASIVANKSRTNTDSLGFFSLSIGKAPYSIHVSSIGYIKLDTLISDPSQHLILKLWPENYKLKDITTTISTGYQEVKRERLTGAYDQISAKTLNEQVSTTLLERLETIGNGLTVDRTTNTTGKISIRGLSSINGPKDVLIVLDNFPYEGDLSNINPNDVESISILKDAVASSIWGTKAGNGVIVITTKKGRFNSRLSLSASAISTFTEKPNLFKIPAMTSSDYIDVERFLFNQGAYLADYNANDYPALSPVVELLYNPNLNQQQKTTAIEQLKQYDVRNDFNKYFYKTGINQQYSLQATGGSDRYHWAGTAGFDKNSSTLSQSYERLNLRYALSVKVLPNLQADISLMYTGSGSKTGKTAYGQVSSYNGNLYPYARLADDAGNALPIAKNYRLSYLSSLSNKLLDWKYYPLTEDVHNRSISRLDDINLNTGLSYKLADFNFKFLYHLERQVSSSENLQDLNSFGTRNLINSYSQISGTAVTYPIPLGAIDQKSNNVLNTHGLRFQLGYNKRINKHGIEFLAGTERRENIVNRNSDRFYGYNPETMTSIAVDYANLYPNYINGGSSYIPYGVDLGKTNNRYVSFFGNLTYDFGEEYYLYASARRDASNLFGLNTNDKWKPLWSIGAGWILSKTAFVETIKPINYLKLRANFGYSGNADPSKVALTTIGYSAPRSLTQLPYAEIKKFYNPNLKWETVQTMNLGLDFKLLSERINGSIDFYMKRGRDLFSFFPVDYTTGIGSTVIRNVASMSGKGMDININSINLKGSLRWESTLNFSTNGDKITKYYNSASIGNDYISNTAAITGLVGKPVYSIFSYPSPGLDQAGDPIGYLNAQPSKDYTLIIGSGTKIEDLKYHGSALPTAFGNLINRFSYKGFSLQLAIGFKLGYYFRRSTINYSNLTGLMQGHPDYALRWQKPGDELQTVVPAFIYPNNTARNTFYQRSEVLIEKADHIRLQYINFSYSLPKRALGTHSPVTELFLNSSNLGLLWIANKRGIDPEYQDVLWPSKTLSIGLRIKL